MRDRREDSVKITSSNTSTPKVIRSVSDRFSERSASNVNGRSLEDRSSFNF